MFCGKCGKKVHEDMLFCPFCGNAIVVPDQDEDEYEDAAPQNSRASMNRTNEPKKRKPISLFADDYPEEEQEEFVPLSEDKSYDVPDEVSEPESNEVLPDEEIIENSEEDVYDTEQAEPDKFATSVPRMDRSAAPAMNSHRGSYIPVRDTKAEDMFLGAEQDEYDKDEYDDDYDDYDDFSDSYDDDFEDDKPKGGFIKRHIGALIAFCAVVVLLASAAVFAFSTPGQKLLARVNLAWEAKGYALMGLDEYKAGNYPEAASYYVRAIDKDNANYEYAHSAMVAYYEAQDIENAAQMAIKCINMKPEDAEPYRELRTIYGNSEIPAISRNYIQQGYQKTGDEYLNPANWANNK